MSVSQLICLLTYCLTLLIQWLIQFTLMTPVVNLAQMLLDATDPVNYERLVVREPRAGHRPKSVYLTVGIGPDGQGDHYAPPDGIQIGAVAMGLAVTPEEATTSRPHTPKLAFIAPPASYVASGGKAIDHGSIDILARIFSMGVLHHAMTGTGAVAIAAAAAIPGTIVHRVAPPSDDGLVRFGHPSGSLTVGAEAVEDGGEWKVRKVTMSRSARRLMEGWVRVPGDAF